jgi:hypothetical protein
MLNLWGSDPTMVFGLKSHFKHSDFIVQYLLVRVAKQTISVWQPDNCGDVDHALAAHWCDLFWVS